MERFYKDGIKMTHFEEWEEEMVNPRYVCVYSILWTNGTLNKNL